MAKHPCLPGTLTPENLANWITGNSVEQIQHIEKVDLTEDQVHELERQSSLASRAIDRLDDVKEKFMEILKSGTPDIEMPYDITIPPTKGLKILKANREFADKQLEQGFREDITDLYMVPYPEESQMVAVDIEGYEWPAYTRQMTLEQINQHKPMLRKPKKEKNSEDFMEEPGDESPQTELDI